MEEAATYKEPFAHVESHVLPERRGAKEPNLRKYWWRYKRTVPALMQALEGLDCAIAVAQVSKTMMPALISTNQILDAKLIIFATNSLAQLAILSSSMHTQWAIQYGTTMRADATYTPSSLFEPFPRPPANALLEELGGTLQRERSEVMIRRDMGLTKLYNLVNSPEVNSDSDVDRMRQIHLEIDIATLEAYGWNDIELGHGFYTYKKVERWTVSPDARKEVLDRLLEENHLRAAAEVENRPGKPQPTAISMKSAQLIEAQEKMF